MLIVATNQKLSEQKILKQVTFGKNKLLFSRSVNVKKKLLIKALMQRNI